MDNCLMPFEADRSIDLAEGRALALLANKVNGQTFVEVGSWKGHSASIIAPVAKAKGGYLWCIDHWKGSEGTGLIEAAQKADIYWLFKQTMKELGLWNYIKVLRLDSLSASKRFAPNSVDFLFIDGDHRYALFIEDLIAWEPKIKPGGIMCGHDCEMRYSEVAAGLQQYIDQNLAIDFTGQIHAGVIKGLHDCFGDDFMIIPNTRIWAKRRDGIET